MVLNFVLCLFVCGSCARNATSFVRSFRVTSGVDGVRACVCVRVLLIVCLCYDDAFGCTTENERTPVA